MESWFICWDHSLSSSCGHCNFPLPPLEVEPLPTPAPRTSHPLGFAYWWIFKANQTIFASARPLCKQILLDHILHKTRNPISYLLSCAYYFSSHHCFFNSSSCVILLQQHHSKLHRIQILLLLHFICSDMFPYLGSLFNILFSWADSCILWAVNIAIQG